MGRRAFTDRLVGSLTSKGKSQFEHFDGACSGLLLRVTKAGTKTWDFTFKSPRGGKRHRLKIGPYPAISLKIARERARAAQAKIAEGRDPRDVEETPGDKTIAEVIEERLSMVLRGKARSAAQIEWRFQKYVLPIVGSVAIKDFRIDPHYNAIIDPILKRGTVRTAGIVFQDLKALFNFAIERGSIEYSRMARVKRPDCANHRTRFLKMEEIETVWHGLPDVLSRSEHCPTVLRLCLATGQRLSEVAGMRRDEIDLQKGLWTIPAARSKNKHAHTVPLTALADGLVREAMRKSNGDYLFPDRNGSGPIKHNVIDCALRNAQRRRGENPLGKFGVPVWKPHDLRRTLATQLSRLGVSQVVIGHILNHRSVTKTSVTQSIYDQHDFLAEKRDALEKWDALLRNLLLPGDGVVALAA